MGLGSTATHFWVPSLDGSEWPPLGPGRFTPGNTVP
jgi:hypothetical protein